MEFKHGSPERGRAIFEGIVRNYPKRLDLWSVYLDQVFFWVKYYLLQLLASWVISVTFPSMYRSKFRSFNLSAKSFFPVVLNRGFVS